MKWTTKTNSSPRFQAIILLVLRYLALVCLFSVAGSLILAQQRRPTPPPPPEPDEEEAGAEPEYVFNPIQARKELLVGDFYWKKKSYGAAASRYERATRWQPDLAEAYYKLGESREKLGQNETALAAFKKYLELSPSARNAAEVKKKISRLQSKSPKANVPSAAHAP